MFKSVRSLLALSVLSATCIHAGAQSAEPTPGGTVIMALDADPDSLSGAEGGRYGAEDVKAKIYEGLVWLDGESMPQPALASEWTISGDGQTYTFTLRDGVKWHDGENLTSADVKFTFDEALSQYHPRAANMIRRVELQVEAPDDNTVIFKLKQPYAPFLTQLSVMDAPIIPEHIYAGTDIRTNPANDRPIGTGPFVFSGWERGLSITLDRNPDYWDAPKPYLDRIIYQIIPQPAGRVAAMETGEVDFAADYYLPKTDLPRLMDSGQFTVREGGSLPAFYLAMMNLNGPVFDKQEARQAMAFALDRSRMAMQVMNRFGRPGIGAFSDGFRWMLNEEVNYSTLYPLDPEKAKELLAEAGIEPGTEVRVLYEATRPQLVTTAQLIREGLVAVGLQPILEPVENTVLVQRIYERRDFDMAILSYFSSGDPAIGYHRLYLTNTENAINTNGSGYSNPKVDELLNEATAELDREKRGEIYRDVQLILDQELPSLNLFEGQGADLAAPSLQGLFTSIDARARWGDVWVKQ
ncbi:ABC transporter substrate-binding protein [Mesorhizobium sp. CAU 1732]|uniref:ABC transporter substrate-binding protein n=1 Tax=Mesorhizobium sp. CAU 1732 TaxID=3140358 RepID=UPI00326102B6